jgi:hypothetical protein
VVDAGACSAAALAVEDFLYSVEEFLADQWLVAAPVLGALVTYRR